LKHGKLSTPRAAAIGLLAAGVAAFAAPTLAQAAPPEGRVKVMSRNVYLGTSLTDALNAGTPIELALAAQEIWADVDITEFPNRAKLLAKEIDTAKPDLVGLQEVALWRGDFTDEDGNSQGDGPTTPADVVKVDFLDELMTQLNRKNNKVKWGIVRVQKEADIEAPLSGGNPYDGRLTMRDVVLKRKDRGDVSTRFEYSQRFRKDHSLNIENIGGTPLDVTVWRGYIAADANVRGTEFRFVNTHLEAFDNDAKLAQAEELTASIADVAVAGTQDEIGPANPAASDDPIVLVGDLNSDDEIVETMGNTPGHVADELPYAHIVSRGLEERSYDGLNTDGVDDQFSCCFNDELIGEPPATALDDIDHTVDHIMVEDDDHGAGVDPNSNDIELLNSFATGDDPAEFARFDRWASDHLGVVSALQFPTP
jgi:endonuclease/exonuclease/phosphatase family metal-dependent hydrolase